MKALLTKLFQKKLTSEEQKKIDFLSNTDIFKGLKNKDLILISEKMYERNYKKNEIVFFRNDAAQALFLVKTGTVFLNLDIGGKEEELYYCKANDSFGINALLENKTRYFNAQITSEDAVLFVFPQTELLELLNNNLEIKCHILNNLGNIYDRISQKMFKTYRNNIGFFELKNVF